MNFHPYSKKQKVLRELSAGETFVTSMVSDRVYMVVALGRGEVWPRGKGVIDLTDGIQCSNINFDGMVIPIDFKPIEYFAQCEADREGSVGEM